MKKILMMCFIALALMVGCDEDIGTAAYEDAADSKITDEAMASEVAEIELRERINNEPPQFEYDWQCLYYDALIDYIGDPVAMFNIYDLNGDGTPELLLSKASFHAASGSLYSIYEGEVVCFGEYGSWGEFQYDFERNYIHSGFFQMGSLYLNIFSFENGEIAPVVSLYAYDGSFPSIPEEYKINDDVVTQEEFNAEYAKYTFDFREDFSVRKYHTTQREIENVLKQY